MAVAEVVLEVLPQAPPPPPPPPPREPAGALRVPAVPRLVKYLYLASTWVGCASLAASTVARRALGVDSPVTNAFLDVSIGSLVVPVLVIVVVPLQLLRAMCAAGFRSSLRNSAKKLQFEIQSGKMFGVLTWMVLRNPVLVMLLMLVMLVTVLLLLLVGAGALVLGGLLPVEESQREKIGYALFDTGALGAMAMFCFVVIPGSALTVWRSK